MKIFPFSQGADTPSVRISLAVLVVGCIMPIVIVASFMVFDFYQREHFQLIGNALSRARAMISMVDRQFASTQAALQALSTSGALARGELNVFHARAVEALAYIHADSIVVVNVEGQLLLSTSTPFGTSLPKLKSAPLLKRVLNTGKPGVSDLYAGPIVGYPIYTIGVPIHRDDATGFLLAATAAPVRLASILEEQRLPSNWRAAITDSAGSVVARSQDIEKFLGKKISPELLSQTRIMDEGVVKSTTLDGIPVVSVYSRSLVTGWAVVLGIPLADLTAGLRQTMIWLVIATLTATAAGLGFAWFIAGKIAQSISLLIGPAIALGSGVMPAIPHLYLKEANVLGAALGDAATRLHETQAGLRESNKRLFLAAEATRLGFWTRDLVRNEIWASDQWRTMFGFSELQRIELVSMLQRIHPDDRAAVNLTLTEEWQGVGAYETEYRIELPNTGVRWIGSRGRVEFDGARRPILVRGVSFDITARKQAELDLRQKQEEIMHLSRVTMLGELSGALAHELNQPLTAILSNAQAAQRFMATDNVDLNELRAILQDIVDEDKRASEVIRRLRRLFDKSEPLRQSVALNELVLDVARILRNDLINHGITLITELAPESPMVCADRVQLQQVLINLIRNAGDAMSLLSGPERLIVVRIGLACDAMAQVSVIDQGAGIPSESLERIFDPFYTTKEAGMGLGLSICRNIVTANDGHLWGENNPDHGASFHVRLPLQVNQVP